MEVIGDRISILSKENLLSIVILPTTNKKKVGLLFLWLLAWTVCGLIVFINYFKLQNRDAKIFVIIYLSFWLYFEFKISRAFMWKKFGKEKIWIQNGVLHYQREINKTGKIQEFDPSLINDLKLIEVHEGDFSDFINKSFWIKGGERIEFGYQGKVIRFGMQLSDGEARTILSKIRQAIKS